MCKIELKADSRAMVVAVVDEKVDSSRARKKVEIDDSNDFVREFAEICFLDGLTKSTIPCFLSHP